MEENKIINIYKDKDLNFIKNYNLENKKFFKENEKLLRFSIFNNKKNFLTVEDFASYLHDSIIYSFSELTIDSNYNYLIKNFFVYFLDFVDNLFIVDYILDDHLILIINDLINIHYDVISDFNIDEKIYEMYNSGNHILKEEQVFIKTYILKISKKYDEILDYPNNFESKEQIISCLSELTELFLLEMINIINKKYEI